MDPQPTPNPAAPRPAAARADPDWLAFRDAALRRFHAYASWLVSISWMRFIVLAVLLVIAAEMASRLPIFGWTVTEWVEEPRPPKPPKPPRVPEPTKPPVIRIEKPSTGGASGDGIDISIDERGIRITPRKNAARADAAASASSDSARCRPAARRSALS